MPLKWKPVSYGLQGGGSQAPGVGEPHSVGPVWPLGPSGYLVVENEDVGNLPKLSSGETVGTFLQSFSATSLWKGSALSLILSHSGASHSSPGSSVSPGKTIFKAWGSAWEYNLSRREGRILLATVLTPKSIQRPGWQCACVCWILCFILLLDFHKGTWVGTLLPIGLVSFFIFFSCL